MDANQPGVIPNNAGDVNSNQSFNQKQPLMPQNANDVNLGDQNNSLNNNTNEDLNVFFYHKKKGEDDRVKIAEQLDVNPNDLDENGELKPYCPISYLKEIENNVASSNCQQNDASILAGCPAGNDSGGICTPFSNEHRSRWMQAYGGPSALTIPNLILPGTHNSGFDKEASYTPSSETCQDRSPYTQLMTGIRVLDIRTQFYSGYGWGDPRRFQIFHDANSGRTIENDILGGLNSFRYAGLGSGACFPDPCPTNLDEIVILDFHQFKNFTADAHRELAEIIKNKVNNSCVNPARTCLGKIIEPSLKSYTVGQIRNRGNKENTVIAYNATPRDASFWPGVNQRWIGKNDPSESELKSFMDRVGNETKPTDEIRSIQCARYVWPFFVPRDMSDSIRQWFYSENKNSYIQKFYIINTDWSMRQRLIDNCIHANWYRAYG